MLRNIKLDGHSRHLFSGENGAPHCMKWFRYEREYLIFPLLMKYLMGLRTRNLAQRITVNVFSSVLPVIKKVILKASFDDFIFNKNTFKKTLKYNFVKAHKIKRDSIF